MHRNSFSVYFGHDLPVYGLSEFWAVVIPVFYVDGKPSNTFILTLIVWGEGGAHLAMRRKNKWKVPVFSQ